MVNLDKIDQLPDKRGDTRPWQAHIYTKDVISPEMKSKTLGSKTTAMVGFPQIKTYIGVEREKDNILN